jgi:acyl carrier protein
VDDRIVEIIAAAVKELNEELEYDSLDNCNPDTRLYGGEDGIDSLSLVRLITEIEAQINDTFDSDVLLASEKAMSMVNSPFRSVATLAAFIDSELKAQA